MTDLLHGGIEERCLEKRKKRTKVCLFHPIKIEKMEEKTCYPEKKEIIFPEFFFMPAEFEEKMRKSCMSVWENNRRNNAMNMTQKKEKIVF